MVTMSEFPSPKEHFLDVYEREHATTMRVLRAFPTDKLDMRASDTMRTARELAWIFVLERGLARAIFNDAFAQGKMSGSPPPAPDSWDELLTALDKAHKELGDLIRAAPDDALLEKTSFFVSPKKLGEQTRLDWMWYLLLDQIHHRGQFSVYLRMAGGIVPSIYGPTKEEQWV
jgi:uncharacterized damage-inducible protein DinB